MNGTSHIIPRDPVTGEVDDEETSQPTDDAVERVARAIFETDMHPFGNFRWENNQSVAVQQRYHSLARAALQASQPAPTPADGTYDAYIRGFRDGREEGLSLAKRQLHCAQESTDAAISDYNDALGRIEELERGADRFDAVLRDKLREQVDRANAAEARIVTLEAALRRIRDNPAGADIVAQYALPQQQERQ